MTPDDLEALEETIFWQGQPDVAKDAASGRAEAEAGELFDEAAVRRRYGLERGR